MRNIYKYLFISILLYLFKGDYAFSQENYTINKLKLNTDQYGEVGGYFFDNLLIYSSNGSLDGVMNFSYNLFKIVQKEDQTWSKPELFDFDLTTNQHNAPIFLNKAKNKIYITSCNVSIDKFNNMSEEGIESGIYTREYNNGRWSYTATGFVYNKPGYIVGHACLNETEDELYFIANYDGGKGGTDLYKSILVNGAWSEPQNLGTEINTDGNEMYPFIRNNRLYFSSNKHNSRGGLDIFYSEFKNGKWLKPVPVGKPLNSMNNDFAFFIDEKLERGFFTSYRDGSYDIFSIISNYQEFTDCKEVVATSKCVTLFETRTSGLDTAQFQYEWELGDGNIMYGEEIDYCYENYGNYEVTLNVIDKLTNMKIEDVAMANIDLYIKEGIYFDLPENSQINKSIDFNNVLVNLPELDKYILYWDFGDGYKSSNENETHQYKNTGEYLVKLGLVSDQGVMKELQKYCVFKKINITK